MGAFVAMKIRDRWLRAVVDFVYRPHESFFPSPSAQQLTASSDCKLRLCVLVVYPLQSVQHQFCNHGIF